MKHYFIIILAFVILSNNSFGQQSIQEAQYKGGNKALAKYLQNKFERTVHPMDLACTISVLFAKFTIDANGNIASIKISNKNSPKVLQEALISIINSTSGNWSPRLIEGKAVESKPFVLPLIYQIEAGCQGKSVFNSTDQALSEFLIYGENGIGVNESQLDCILLKALNIFSQN
jgi:hypothetical protein